MQLLHFTWQIETDLRSCWNNLTFKNWCWLFVVANSTELDSQSHSTWCGHHPHRQQGWQSNLLFWMDYSVHHFLLHSTTHLVVSADNSAWSVVLDTKTTWHLQMHVWPTSWISHCEWTVSPQPNSTVDSKKALVTFVLRVPVCLSFLAKTHFCQDFDSSWRKNAIPQNTS